MNNWDSFIENCESEEYSLCAVVVDGIQYKNTAIRAKGNTSLSSVRSMGSQRYSFKLEFDHYEDGKNCDGLDKLCLNNLIQDNTMMKDYLVYTLMNDFEVDSPLCSFAYITVNGEDWGLYLAVEGIEDSFLSRNYGSDSGELYKPDSMGLGGGRGNGKNFNMEDFKQPGSLGPQGEMPQMPEDNWQQGDFQQKPNNSPRENSQQFDFSNMFREFGGGFGDMGDADVKLNYIDEDPESYSSIFGNAKTDVSSGDKKRLIYALKNLSEYIDLENTLDMNEVLRYFVVHNFVVNGDSYTGSMIHNYYLHEKDGKLGMIPWDYNLAFGTFQGGNASSSVNDSIDKVLSDRPMQAWIYSDEEYTEQYHALFADFIEQWFTDAELEQLIADIASMIRPYIEKDPSKFCTTEEFDKGVQALEQFVKLRGESVIRQLEGNTTAVETGNLNLSDMGSMDRGFEDGNQARSDYRFTWDSPKEPEGEKIPKLFNQAAQFENAEKDNKDNKGEEFDFHRDTLPENVPGQSGVDKWIFVGVSFLVLVAGLMIVMKKKN